MIAESVDLAVVGCGVSGASAARTAAQKGLSVALLEEHPQVGEPSHCSGHVGILAFKQFSPRIPKRIIENRIKGAVLHSPTGRAITLHRPNPVTFVLNRSAFDRHLASLAEESGSQLHLNSRVDSFRRSDNDGLKLRVAGSKDREISCKILIDASGCSASISKYAGLSLRSNRTFVNSAQFSADNLRDVDQDFVEVYFGQRFAPGFFGWVIPRRDGSAKIGIAAGARANVRECLERFIRKHPVASAKLKRAKSLTRPRFHPIPVGAPSSKTYADSVLSVGDAAGQVKATTGGGIVFGMACGRIAGETAADAVKGSDTSSKCLSRYEGLWRQLIGFDLKAMSWLRRALYRLPDAYLDRIFKIASELKADQILTRTADIDFQGRTVLSLARDPRFFITLVSAGVLSTPSLSRRH